MDLSKNKFNIRENKTDMEQVQVLSLKVAINLSKWPRFVRNMGAQRKSG
jgi:hypothetical protein